ncbi:MAG: glycosyltransferase [Verrucomicrobia bacterium]|nr:glycosyltransferase [Verrucomicrobiota bacterium]
MATASEVPGSGRPGSLVVFAFVGTLDFRGRLRKEIATLRGAGVACRLVLGEIGERRPREEDYDFPIEVLRVPCFKGKVRYFLHQLRYAWRAGRRIADLAPQAVVCVGLDCALAGVVAKWFRPGIRLIFDSNELYLESMNSRVRRMVWNPLQTMVLKACDGIFHAEANRMEYFKRTYGRKDKPQLVVENFPDYHVGEARVAPSDGPLKVIYLGALGGDRYTHELIAAGMAMEGVIELDLVGFATPEVMADLERRYGARPAPNIRILPAVAYHDIPELLRSYHIGIALYKNTNLNNYYCAPNKVYDYLMSGMAVIANDYPGLRKVIEGNRVGACVADLTPASFEGAVRRIAEERCWDNITDAIRRKYCWEAQEAQLVDAVLGVKR